METDITGIIESIILVLLGLSSLLGVLDYVGLLPSCVRSFFRVNRADDTIRVLEELGINVGRYKVKNESFNYPKTMDQRDLESVTLKKINKVKIQKEVAVGKNRSIGLKCYYDIIGTSCNEQEAKYFASLLSNYLYILIEGNNYSADYNYDFIVTPKGGSPILGYEFSKIVNKPFILHEDSPRFKECEMDMRSVFDCHRIPDRGSTALIIDDSTTGGSLVCDTIDDLKTYGYNVFFCLVVFEPIVKDARSRINNKGVSLFSIIKTHA